jgi:ankyrin repeat protein
LLQVKILLASGLDLEIKDYESRGNFFRERFRTPLFVACQEGHLDIVKVLISAGADVNSSQKYTNFSFCESMLMTACSSGHYEIAKVLITAGADVNFVMDYGCGEPMVSTCLEQVVDRYCFYYRHYRGVPGPYPVEEQCKEEDLIPLLEIVKMLIDAGVDVNCTASHYYYSPIQMACYHGCLEIVKMLINANYSTTGEWVSGRWVSPCSRHHPLSIARKRGHLEIEKFLVDRGVHLAWTQRY